MRKSLFSLAVIALLANPVLANESKKGPLHGKKTHAPAAEKHASVPVEKHDVPHPVAHAPAANSHGVHWTYDGEHGAEHWGDLEGNAMCKIGRVQSPINISTRAVPSAPISPIRFNYTMSNGEVVNNGHTLQVNFKPGNSIEVEGTNYALLQFHFHAPSEEGFDNIRYPMVAHFVHKSAEGKLAVVALLFSVGDEHKILKNVFAKFPTEESKKDEVANIDLGRIFTGAQKYYGFMGSLTTPPCSEGVKWHVLKTSQEISLSQLIEFKSLYPTNARPFQAVNEREIRVSE